MLKNIINKFLFAVLCVVAGAGIAHAVCPVCTVAVGAGAGFLAELGVDYVLIGIWAGGLTLSLFFWTAGWLKKHGVNNIFLQIILPFVVYYGLLAAVYWVPGGPVYRATCLWGMDKFALGALVGTVTFYLGARWYNKIKRANGGHAKFAFQKVVVPVFFLVVVTAIFWMITQCD